MNFKKSKLYKTIVSGTPENVMKALWEYLKSGKDVNLKDETTGETLLHLLVNNGERFSSPDTIQAIYMLVCKDIEIDAQDSDGETGLHKVMRKPGAYRIMMALVRCGADTTIKNKKGKTAEDVLLEEKPEGWQEMYHWYNKFKPGLWSALSEPNPDRKTVERLLKNWCRLTCVKDGKVMNLKSLVKDDVHKIDVYHMLEEYENANEMALALQAGFGFIVKTWLKQGTDLLKTTNPNAMDHSYQYSFPSYPAVPRPLLMAAWETNSYDTVDVLMSMKPDTRVLFTYEEENKSPPKPLFFQLVCGASIPTDEKILLRVFKECDLQARDSEGQSILHKVILHDQPVNRMNILLQYGASLTARDLKGKTPRDLAETLEKNTYTQCMDEFVIKLVKDKKFEEVEKLIFYSYDCICDIKDSSGRSILDIAKKVSQKMYEIIKLAPAKQSHMRKVFETVDDGKEEDLKKLLSCRKYHCIRDKCGRTLVHRAIKMKRKAIAIYLVNEYPESVHVGDTMDRTPLHYAALLLPDTELMECLISHGADENRADALGYVSKSYTKDKIGEQRLNDLVKSLNDLDLNIFITETNFESSFRKAIQDGNLEMVRQLVAGLQTFGDTSRYSSFLFDCIDYDQTDIAKFLILSGFNCEIYKQYQKCDPSDPMCAMMECDHVSVSLRERANEKKCDEVVSLIDSISNGKGHVHVNGIENKHVTHQSQNCTTVNG